MCGCLAACLCALADAHSMMIKPKPRNAIDSELPEWSNGCVPPAARRPTESSDSLAADNSLPLLPYAGKHLTGGGGRRPTRTVWPRAHAGTDPNRAPQRRRACT